MRFHTSLLSNFRSPVVDHRSPNRWLLPLCSILLLFLVLTGCREASPTPESVLPTPTPTPIRPTPTPTPIPELQPMVVTLGLWLPAELDPYGGRAGANILAQQLDDFSEAYPDVQVEVVVKQAHGRGGLLDFMQTAREAVPSILPDLVVLDATTLETAARSNLIQPLDPLLSPTEMTERFPFAAELGTVDGQTFGFVVGADMQHMAYRQNALDSPPVSWNQVISPPVSFLIPAGGRDQQVNDATLIQYLAAGGTLVNDEGNPMLDEEVMLSVLDFYSDCVGAAEFTPTVSLVISPTIARILSPTVSPSISPTVPPTVTVEVITVTIPVTIAIPISPTAPLAISPTVVLGIQDADQAWEQFLNGQGDAVVVRAGRYWLETGEAVAAAPLPTQDGQPFSVARGWVIAMVTEDPARQALANLLFDWLTAPDHNGQWTQAAGYLPGTRGALRMWNISNADRAMLRGVMDAAIPAPRPEVMATAGQAMQEALEAVLRRRASPEEAAATAVDSMGR
jgi:ABC-type glycerol-3-phosphate transport system substrate-binding protein